MTPSTKRPKGHAHPLKAYRVTISQSTWSVGVVMACSESAARAEAERLWLEDENTFSAKGGDHEVIDVELAD